MFQDVTTKFIPEFSYEQINKGSLRHSPGCKIRASDAASRIEKRSISICQKLDSLRFWPGLKTLIRVESERQIISHNHIEVEKETRYYISSLSTTAREFGERICGYWGVENKVHYVREVTQAEDKSRIRTTPLPQIFAIARNFTLN